VPSYWISRVRLRFADSRWLLTGFNSSSHDDLVRRIVGLPDEYSGQTGICKYLLQGTTGERDRAYSVAEQPPVPAISEGSTRLLKYTMA
jgi:hypothetical protein